MSNNEGLARANSSRQPFKPAHPHQPKSATAAHPAFQLRTPPRDDSPELRRKRCRLGAGRQSFGSCRVGLRCQDALMRCSHGSAGGRIPAGVSQRPCSQPARAGATRPVCAGPPRTSCCHQGRNSTPAPPLPPIHTRVPAALILWLEAAVRPSLFEVVVKAARAGDKSVRYSIIVLSWQ